MNKNPVRDSLLRRLRLFTLMSFLQFAVINDGYTYFLSTVQPMHPAASIATIFALTVDLHHSLVFSKPVSSLSEVHRALTQATLKSLHWIERAAKSGWDKPVQAAARYWAKSAHGASHIWLAEADEISALQESYIGGKKESWTKFDPLQFERFSPLHLNEWEMKFVDEIIDAAQRALERSDTPDLKRRKSMPRIHYGTEDDPDRALTFLGREKSPGSLQAGWLFYWAKNAPRRGERP